MDAIASSTQLSLLFLQEAQRQEELRLKSAMRSNIFERALDQMMGGTLEKRAEIEDEFNIEPPQWLNDEPHDLTEEQVIEVGSVNSFLEM